MAFWVKLESFVMSDKPKIKEYSNDDVTVIWQPSACIHSENCWKGLPEVFDPNSRPWIKIDAASSDRIINQVKKCPSGALSYRQNTKEENMEENSVLQVEIIPDGPLMVPGPLVVNGAKGEQKIEREKVFFCRCGHSANKPFCDGSHRREGFKAD